MHRVFVDTAAFYGFLYKQDTLHKLCKQIFKYLVKSQFGFITHRWVEYETLSKLKEISHTHCLAYQDLADRLQLSIEDVAPDLEELALETFWAYQDKKWSIIDCVSINLMWNENIQFAFTSDRHFKQAGFFTLMEITTRGPRKTFSDIV